MANDDDGLERDPALARWLAQVEAPAQADVDRLAGRVSRAVRDGWPVPVLRTWRTETAGWSRLLVPVAAAAGIAAAVVVGRIGTPSYAAGALAQDSTQLLDVLRRTDAENYLVTVAVTNYREDWAAGLVGSER